MSQAAIDVVYPLYRASKWLKFLGVINMVFGILYCLTIVGAIVGWLPIWIGWLAMQSANKYREGVDRQNDLALGEASSRLATLITIFGVLALIGLIVAVLQILLMIAFFVIAGGAAIAANAG